MFSINVLPASITCNPFHLLLHSCMSFNIHAHVQISITLTYTCTFFLFSGYLHDRSGSYNNTFYFSGIFIICAGLIVIAVPICKAIKRHCESRSLQIEKDSKMQDDDLTRVKFIAKEVAV